ncbi:hypothetical protein [Aeromicrobium sp.]|uniref:hypothetical protein n=1 Tax=Aeromicrobium sp. TaxID=1871063 RepID=UPI0025B876D9|nr:hypothetical protein [Aeromicrobium sp.]MCK5891810.1 hypothetical protein [Aeromicrobium sp.]
MRAHNDWQALASLLLDVGWYLMWLTYGGLVALGSCWCLGYGGYRAWQEWDRDWSQRRAERRLQRTERRLQREIDVGLRQVEHFLQHEMPVATAEGTETKRRPQSRGDEADL